MSAVRNGRWPTVSKLHQPGKTKKGLDIHPRPRAHFVAGRSEPFFRNNAARWADALRDAGADVVMTVRDGGHGGDFWRTELPLMTARAFGQRSGMIGAES